MKNDNIPVPLPYVELGEYLASYLWDAGTCVYGAMGPSPLPHSEIESWQRNSGVELQPWEVSIVRFLSVEYIKASKEAESINCPPPWSPTIEQGQRESVAKRVKSVLRD